MYFTKQGYDIKKRYAISNRNCSKSAKFYSSYYFVLVKETFIDNLKYYKTGFIIEWLLVTKV